MDDLDTHSYINDHQRLAEPSRYAAVVIANLLDRWLKIESVLDLGCGIGSWLRGFASGGRREVFGVEGERLEPQYLEVDPDLIVQADLSERLDLHRRFDLVICLEVAEHIPAEAAETLIDNCVRHADVVLFSAAIPGQQGQHHVNEQLPEYWVGQFASQSYIAFDVIRPHIWNDRNIPIWYRQNALLLVRDDLPVVLQLHAEANRLAAATPLNRAHPDLLRWHANDAMLARSAINEANHSNQALRGTIAETVAQLNAARNELKIAKNELNAARSKLNAANKDLRRSADAMTLLRRERDAVINSSLWRVMGPFRHIGNAVPLPARLMLRRALREGAAITRKLRSPRKVPAEVDPVPTGRAIATSNWRIVVISGEPHNPGHLYRAFRFAEAAKAIGADVRLIRVDEVSAHHSDLVQAHIVMIWRAAMTSEVAAAIEAIRRGGGKLLVDVDDLMFVPALATEEVIDGIRSQGLDAVATSELFLRVRQVMAEADICICSTNVLAMHARQLETMTFLLPNGFDADVLTTSRLAVRRRRADPRDDLIRIGYAAGTRTHQRDFGTAADALVGILRQFPSCRLVLFRDRSTGQPMLDLDEFPPLQQRAGQIEWRDLVPISELPNELARFDINIAPLETGNPFCEAKSELKFFEAALAGVCTVASPTEPMRQAIRHGETGMLADTQDSWTAAMRTLVEDPALRERIAHAAYLDVLWRYGPQRRADQVLALVTQLAGGQDAARAFELEFRRGTARRSTLPDTGPSEVVFAADFLGTAEVSIIIPLFNYAGYVTEALDSVMLQTLGSLDLIIIDDFSTDDSLQVALTWAKGQADSGRFNRIVVMRNQSNYGLARTRNIGFDVAETEFVVPLDADNRLRPEFCAKTLAAVRGTRAAFAYTKIQCFGDHQHIIGTNTFSQMRFVHANYVDAMALVAKWAWAAVGGYTHIQLGWEDYDFWCCCIEHGFWGIHVPEILAEYRSHEGSMLRTITDIPHNQWKVARHLEGRHEWLSIDKG